MLTLISLLVVLYLSGTLSWDCSDAYGLDLWRRFKAVMDVLDAMIRDGISLARSVELTAQWDEILWVGPVNPLGWGNFELARGRCASKGRSYSWVAELREGGSGLTWCPLPLFLHGGSGVLADPARIDE